MARKVGPDTGLSRGVKAQVEKALNEGDFGEEQPDGTFFKSLTPIPQRPSRSKGEVEEAAPRKALKPKTPAELERLPQELAYQLMAHYVNTLNDRAQINPIIDGIPQCVKHRFKPGREPGCFYGCKTGILPRSQGQSVGDVLEWVKGLISYNFKLWQKENPGFKGFVSGIIY